MRPTRIVLAALVLAAAAAQASMVEDRLRAACSALPGSGVVAVDPRECTYQFDGGAHGDAPATCMPASPVLKRGPPPTSGMLVPLDDRVDNFRLNVADLQPVTITAAVGAVPRVLGTLGLWDIDLVVYGPACRAVVAEARGPGPIRVQFVPRELGAHTVSLVLAESPLAAEELLPGYGTAVCHSTCVAAANPAVGYTLVAT